LSEEVNKLIPLKPVAQLHEIIPFHHGELFRDLIS